MANIPSKLNYTFTDNQTTIMAEHLNAFVTAINGLIDVVSEQPTPTQQVERPTISISGTTATISCSTSGATIYYTLNGNTPTTSSTQYSSPITLSGACTIKAIAVKSGMNNSSVASQPYSPASPVVYKSYATTTADDQYVPIANNSASILADLEALSMTNFKVEVSAMLTSTTDSKPCIFSTRTAGYIGKYGSNIHADVSLASASTSVVAAATGSYVMGVNPGAGTSYIGEQTFSDTAYSTSSSIKKALIFGRQNGDNYSSDTAKAGVWKLAYCKIWDTTTNTLVAEIVPATYNGTPCLYDKVSNTPLYPNTGTLAVE